MLTAIKTQTLGIIAILFLLTSCSVHMGTSNYHIKNDPLIKEAEMAARQGDWQMAMNKWEACLDSKRKLAVKKAAYNRAVTLYHFGYVDSAICLAEDAAALYKYRKARKILPIWYEEAANLDQRSMVAEDDWDNYQYRRPVWGCYGTWNAPAIRTASIWEIEFGVGEGTDASSIASASTPPPYPIKVCKPMPPNATPEPAWPNNDWWAENNSTSTNRSSLSSQPAMAKCPKQTAVDQAFGTMATVMTSNNGPGLVNKGKDVYDDTKQKVKDGLDNYAPKGLFK